MEKHGAIQPGVTPPEHGDTEDAVKKAAAARLLAPQEQHQAVESLDSDFRKSAAEAARKSL